MRQPHLRSMKSLWTPYFLLLALLASACGGGGGGGGGGTAAPGLAAVFPSGGYQGHSVHVLLNGSGFRPGMTATLSTSPPVSVTNLSVTSSGRAQGDVSLGSMAAGVYDARVTNPDGKSATLPSAFAVVVPTAMALEPVDPSAACTCSATTAFVASTNGDFVSTPTVEIHLHGSTTPAIAIDRVAFLGSGSISILVPAGITPGSYDISVLDPISAGLVGTLANGLQVVSQQAPAISAVVPATGTPGADTAVSISGTGFRGPVTVELLDRTGTVVGTVTGVTPVSATQVDVTLPTTGLAEDTYQLRVTDTDEGSAGSFFRFVVGSSGAGATLVHPATSVAALPIARRLPAGASGQDDLGNLFVYAIGGDSGSAGTPLDSVDVAQLGHFGAIDSWTTSPNRLTTARAAATAVTVPVYSGSSLVKEYVYVSGGRDASGTVLGSVERAVVLRAADAPVIATTTASTGALAAGTWYYRVSAVLDANDPDNPGGETVPSAEAIITVGPDSGVSLSWNAVTLNGLSAASYRIYRTASADGISGEERRIATVSGTTFTDTGIAAGSEKPLPAGSLGAWQLQSVSHAARWGHQAALVTDSTGARYLYVLGGTSDGGVTYVGTVEAAPVSDAGQISAFSSGNTTAMSTPRAFFSLAVETAQNVSGYTGVARFITVGGMTASGVSSAFEFSDAADGGGNGSWSSYGGSGTKPARAGPAASILRHNLVVLGGAGTAAGNPVSFSNVSASGSSVVFSSNGALGSPISPTANSFPTATAFCTTVEQGGLLYLLGGSSDGSNALTQALQTF